MNDRLVVHWIRHIGYAIWSFEWIGGGWRASLSSVDPVKVCCSKVHVVERQSVKVVMRFGRQTVSCSIE